MSTEQNKAIIRHLLKGLNTKNSTVIETLVDEIFAADFVVHANAQPGAAIGWTGLKQHFRDGLAKWPDRDFTIDDLIAEEDKVVMRVTRRGTDAATGKPANSRAICVYRFAEGRIAELWQVSIETETQL